MKSVMMTFWHFDSISRHLNWCSWTVPSKAFLWLCILIKYFRNAYSSFALPQFFIFKNTIKTAFISARITSHLSWLDWIIWIIKFYAGQKRHFYHTTGIWSIITVLVFIRDANCCYLGWIKSSFKWIFLSPSGMNWVSKYRYLFKS